MAESLVTQVSQDQDPAKLAELARLQAEQAKKKKEQEASSSPKPQAEKKAEEKPQEKPFSCCWRFFCCCFNRKKPSKPTTSSATSTTATGSSTSTSTETTKTPVPESTEPTSTQKSLLGPLPPECKGMKTLVLDLDETLVHSSFRPVPSPDFVISIELDGVTHRVYVQKRPGVDQFLEECAAKFEVVVFTASLDKYANPLMDILDPKGFVKVRLFRESCVQHYGNYVKDLSLLGRRLEDTLIIDNSPFSYMFQPDNAIPITSWFNDRSDRELYDLIPFLMEQIVPCADVSQVIKERKQMVMTTEVAAGEEGGEEEGGEEETDE
jgi:RNA polymerase II subunit A small phosphatase-like protein